MLKSEIKFINIKKPRKKVKSYSSINSKTMGKLLKRYKLTTRAKEEILKAAQKRSTHHSILRRLATKIEFKESIANKNKHL